LVRGTLKLGHCLTGEQTSQRDERRRRLAFGEPDPVGLDRLVGLSTWTRFEETAALHTRQGSVTT
jgi:hypothetical protein